MEYLIIIEKSKNGYGAYPPDLPGIGVAAKTKKETLKLVKEAIEIHLEDLSERGIKIPKPKNEAFSVKNEYKSSLILNILSQKKNSLMICFHLNIFHPYRVYTSITSIIKYLHGNL